MPLFHQWIWLSGSTSTSKWWRMYMRICVFHLFPSCGQNELLLLIPQGREWFIRRPRLYILTREPFVNLCALFLLYNNKLGWNGKYMLCKHWRMITRFNELVVAYIVFNFEHVGVRLAGVVQLEGAYKRVVRVMLLWVSGIVGIASGW